MNSRALDLEASPSVSAGRRPISGATVLALATAGAALLALHAIVPLTWGLALIGVLIWFAIPGVVLARCLYRSESGGWFAACVAGPAWGYVLSSLVLLGLWAAGFRGGRILMLAPIPAAIAVLPALFLARNLEAPRLGRRDAGALALVLLTVPLVVGLPFAHVGADLPEGRAYRAYFTADFVWEMAVVGEVAKGDMPPRNPYYMNDGLHYYWLMHLLPSVEHRLIGSRLRIEQLLLVNALWAGLTFAAFYYFFVRHFVERPWVAAISCAGVIFCSSFEGAEEMWSFWRRGRSLEALRYLNIDAITRWNYQSLPIDGLQRLLLYQPQHQLGYLLGFSALLLLMHARDRGRWGLLFLTGSFLAMSMLMSSFAAVMLALVVAAFEGWSLLAARQWKAIPPCALAAAAPMAAALLVIQKLRYIDAGTPLLVFGWNLMALRSWEMAIFLSFGPVLLIAAIGLAIAAWQRKLTPLFPLGLVLAMCAVFYFLVDVPDHGHVYVGWHVGKIAFVALTPFCAIALQESWRRGGWPRLAMAAFAAIVAVVALPTVVVDLYNTQDVTNREMGPGFRWTVLLNPDEVKALDWIRDHTPIRARVQVEPEVRGRETWAYLPAFAERRMSAGLPISMIPLAKYEQASKNIKALYQSSSAVQAYDRAVDLCIDYLVIGPPERQTYPKLEPLVEQNTELFATAFRNQAVGVYFVPRPRNAPSCPR
jgi:hypothetical protein